MNQKHSRFSRTQTALAFLMIAVFAPNISARPPIVPNLTPDKMTGLGFSLFYRFTDQTTSDSKGGPRPTGMVNVQILFDAKKGPTIDRIEKFELFLHDGTAVVLAVPIAQAVHPNTGKVLFLQFSIHKDLLGKAQVYMRERGDLHVPEYIMAVKDFR
jgi:hypothetical protein